MTHDQLLSRLNVLLDKYEALILESERWKKQGVQPAAFFAGQMDILITICTDLEALILEAAGQPMPFEHTALSELAEQHESTLTKEVSE